MAKKIILSYLLITTILNAVDIPFTYVVSSHESSYFFVMDKNSTGVCYEVVSAENLKVLWSTNNWYSFAEELLLSSNGRSLIRVLPLITGPSEEIISIPILKFYDKGKLVKEYNLEDLNIDTTKVLRYPRSPERKMFLGGENGAKIVTYNDVLRILAEEKNVYLIAENRNKQTESYLLLELIDGKRFVFDLLSGDILVNEQWKK
jgi:hypothetical protein